MLPPPFQLYPSTGLGMEPVSALAFACNILDLIERGIKCGKIVYILYEDGITKDQDDLESMADTMDSVVAGLQKAPANTGIRKSAWDPQIDRVLTKSTAVCAKLRDLIKKCQPETKGSWKAAGVAALKKLVHKSDIEALETDLETCRTDLSTLLSAATQ